MSASPRALPALALAAAAACTVPAVELAGKACDLDGGHPCVEGFACVAGLCVKESGAPDAGEPDAGGDGCAEGEERPCGAGLGDCLGSQRCGDGRWGACVEPTPTSERCDGRDNDCDGDTDEPEEVLLTASPCELSLGVCAGSRKRCIDGVEAPCDDADYGAAYRVGPETICDGQDNNCDGRTDEGLDDDLDGWGAEAVCPKGIGGDCDDWEPASHRQAEEICDGKDNDCDGQTDEAFQCVLGHDEGPCASGRSVCAADCMRYECLAKEICNGLDDDGRNGVDDGIETPWGPPLGPSLRTSRPGVVALPGERFLVAHALSGGLAVRHLAGGSVGPLQLIAGAASPHALSPKLLVYQASQGGLWGVRLGSEGPQGSPLPVVDMDGSAVAGVAAMDLRDGRTLVAAIVEGQLHRRVIGGVVKPPDALAPSDGTFPGGVALAGTALSPLVIVEARSSTPPRTSRLLVYEGFPAPPETPLSPMPTSVVDAREPSAAGGALAFTATPPGGGRQVLLARVKTVPLLAAELLALPGGGDAASPALAALGGETYFVAWVDLLGGRRMVRGRLASWHSGSATWTLHPGETPFGHADGTTPVATCAAATDGTRFFVPFGTAGASDELFSKFVCP